MAGRVGRIAAATVMVAVTGTGTAMIGAGTANAAKVNPLIAGSCDSVVHAKPGQAIKVDPSGLLGKAVAPIYLGAAPSSGTHTLSLPTTQLLKTVGNLPLLGGLLNSVTNVIGPSCDVTVKVANAVHKPVAQSPVGEATRGTGDMTHKVVKDTGDTISGLLPDQPPNGNPGGPPAGKPPGTGQPGGGPGGGGGGGKNPPQQGGGGFQFFPPGGSFDQFPPLIPVGQYPGFGSVFGPGARYGNLPFVTSGLFQPGQNGFGQQVPGFSPRFGVLGEDGNDQGVQNAGQAEALSPGGTVGNDVGLPLLIAVLALSGVSASLVRTWVLRRAS